MPAHIYLETGLYAKAVAASERAWEMRTAWNAGPHPYELEYGPHDAGLGYAASMMLGDLQLAQRWATRLEGLSGSSMQLVTLARFGQWPQIAASAQPDSHKPFALGMAYAHLQNLSGAEQQLTELRKLSPYSDLIGLLEAAIAERHGDINAAAGSLQRAIAIQKRDFTSEYIPLFPAGEALGALYIRAGRYSDARAALQETLARLPGDPRALYALALACTHLGDGPLARFPQSARQPSQQFAQRFRAECQPAANASTSTASAEANAPNTLRVRVELFAAITGLGVHPGIHTRLTF